MKFPDIQCGVWQLQQYVRHSSFSIPHTLLLSPPLSLSVLKQPQGNCSTHSNTQESSHFRKAAGCGCQRGSDDTFCGRWPKAVLYKEEQVLQVARHHLVHVQGKTVVQSKSFNPYPLPLRHRDVRYLSVANLEDEFTHPPSLLVKLRLFQPSRKGLGVRGGEVSDE